LFWPPQLDDFVCHFEPAAKGFPEGLIKGLSNDSILNYRWHIRSAVLAAAMTGIEGAEGR
jgi:hypothetical protein